MLELSQLIDNAARVVIRAEQDDDVDLMWGHRFAGLVDAIAQRVGGFTALHLILERLSEILPVEGVR